MRLILIGPRSNLLQVRHPFTRLVSAFRDRVESCKMEVPSSDLRFLVNLYSLQAEWYTRVREVMHLNGGPVCYIRMNIGKVCLSCLFCATTLDFDDKILAFSWRMMGASYWE